MSDRFPTPEEIKKMPTEDIIQKMRLLAAELDARSALALAKAEVRRTAEGRKPE